MNYENHAEFNLSGIDEGLAITTADDTTLHIQGCWPTEHGFTAARSWQDFSAMDAPKTATHAPEIVSINFGLQSGNIRNYSTYIDNGVNKSGFY